MQNTVWCVRTQKSIVFESKVLQVLIQDSTFKLWQHKMKNREFILDLTFYKPWINFSSIISMIGKIKGLQS